MAFRKITYSEAIREGTSQAMGLDKNVMVMGQIIDYKPGVFGTTANLGYENGKFRVRGVPVSDRLMTSAGIGAA